MVMDEVPSGTTFVSASISEGNLTGPSPGAASGSLVGTMNNLKSGGTITITLVLKLVAPRGNWITNVASVQSATFDPKSNNNVAEVRVRIR